MNPSPTDPTPRKLPATLPPTPEASLPLGALDRPRPFRLVSPVSSRFAGSPAGTALANETKGTAHLRRGGREML